LIAPRSIVKTSFQMEYLPSGLHCSGRVTQVQARSFSATCRLPTGETRHITAHWEPSFTSDISAGVIYIKPLGRRVLQCEESSRARATASSWECTPSSRRIARMWLRPWRRSRNVCADASDSPKLTNQVQTPNLVRLQPQPPALRRPSSAVSANQVHEFRGAPSVRHAFPLTAAATAGATSRLKTLGTM
jgi:hypothetical protein